MMKIVMTACALLALTATAQPVPAPPAALPEACFPEWRALAASAGALVPMSGSPAVMWDNGAARLPVNFSGTAHARASWDIPLRADLRLASGVQFDFFCADLAPVSYFTLYLRSGGGWYAATFTPDASNVWQRIVVAKGDARSEGIVGGWGGIDRIRISAWRARDVDTVCAIANLGAAGAEPACLVIRAASCIASMGGEARSLNTYSAAVANALNRVGLSSVLVDDADLAEVPSGGVRLVALPYNPRVPPEVVAWLRRFVDGGGKLLVCYSLPSEVAGLMGLRVTGSHVPKDAAFSGFVGTAEALDAQPPFTPAASWRTTLAVPADGTENARVIAKWRGAGGVETDFPAVTMTASGAFVGHVWLAPAGGAGDAMMRALAGALVPAFWRSSAEACVANVGKSAGAADFASLRARLAGAPEAALAAFAAAEATLGQAREALGACRWHDAIRLGSEADSGALRAWMLAQPSREGEHRAFWCHRAFGLQGKTWDESIRILAGSGFNAILPNMLWAGTAYYPSETLPAYAQLGERGDQLAQCLAACRKYGVRCHVWKVNWNTGGRAPAAFLERMKREARTQVTFGGTSKDEWLCPSHPDNQDLEVESMLEVLRKYAVDGVHFDYIRYPDNDACFCAGCQARFEARLGRKLEGWPQVTRRDAAVREAWQAFRRENISAVVRRVAEGARVVRPGAQVSAAVFRNWRLDRDSVGQDWGMWCEMGWLDFVCPMNYFDSDALFSSTIATQKEWAHNVPLYPGIGLSCWKDTRDAAKLAAQIGIVRGLGLGGFTVFDYGSNAEEVLPLLRLGVTAH